MRPRTETPPAELAAIASHLVGLTDVLREQTMRLNEEAAVAGRIRVATG